jgi:tryptophan-rich sensory protein
MLQYIPIIIPALSGYLTSMFCHVNKTSGIQVSFRPPAFVFSIVWPILYLLFGFSWYFAREKNKILADIFFSILVILLNLWIFIYSCKNNKKDAIYILILSIIFSLLCYTVGNLTSQLLIVPLVGWLLFATLLNIFEVDKN